MARGAFAAAGLAGFGSLGRFSFKAFAGTVLGFTYLPGRLVAAMVAACFVPVRPDFSPAADIGAQPVRDPLLWEFEVLLVVGIVLNSRIRSRHYVVNKCFSQPWEGA